MRVLGWASDQAGCGLYRIGLPMKALAERGHETLATVQIPPSWLDADVFVGQRVAIPGSSVMWQHLAAEGRRLVYELDDNLFDIDFRNERAHALFGRPDFQARIRANLTVASRVTVTTEPLADVVRRLFPGKDVRVVPNFLPAELLEHERPRRDRLTIGWAGSNTHGMDWPEVEDPLRQFLRRNPSVDFHGMGAWRERPGGPLVHYADGLRLPGQVRKTAWAEDVMSVFRTVDFDIALAPLRPHVFNQGKSGCKAVEAAFLGIPILASDLPPYRDVVVEGVTGFLIRRPHEWGRRLRDLVEDEAMRTEMGAKARELARGWTIEGNASKWEEALTEW